jgi:hypothetical protein
VEPASVAVSRIPIAERRPASVHTALDTSFGLIPVSRARSVLDAVARTASPKAVCPSSHHSASATSGTVISTTSCPARTVTSSPGDHSPVNGVGNVVWNLPVL